MVYKQHVSQSFGIEEDLNPADVYSTNPEFLFCPEVEVPLGFLDRIEGQYIVDSGFPCNRPPNTALGSQPHTLQELETPKDHLHAVVK
jgi:hypothetical protein